MAMGTNTDPYQPIERELKITRSILEVLRDFNNPVSIVTKSALVQRDIDILARHGQAQPRQVSLSVTTLDRTSRAHGAARLDAAAPARRDRGAGRRRHAGRRA